MGKCWQHPHCLLSALILEEAKTGRGKCKGCNEAITKGALKIALSLGPTKDVGKVWFHSQCMSSILEPLLSAKGFPSLSISIEKLQGYNSLGKAARSASVSALSEFVGSASDSEDGEDSGSEFDSDAPIVKKRKTNEGKVKKEKGNKKKSKKTEKKKKSKKRGRGEGEEEEDQEEEEEEKEEEKETKPKKVVRRKFDPPLAVPILTRAPSTCSVELDRRWCFLSFNVAGLRSAMAKGLVDYLREEDADVVFLSEIKAEADSTDFDSEALGYEHCYWNSSKVKKGYAGTAFFSKVAPISVKYGVGSETDNEGRAITLEFDAFYLVGVYTVNSGEALKFAEKRAEWDKCLLQHVDTLQETKPTILTGDLNVALNLTDVYDGSKNRQRRLSPGFTDAERINMASLLNDHNFVDVYDHHHKLSQRDRDPTTGKVAVEFDDSPGDDSAEATHYTFFSRRQSMKQKGKGWRLDYFLAHPDLLPCVQSINIRRENEVSDHLPLVCVLE